MSLTDDLQDSAASKEPDKKAWATVGLEGGEFDTGTLVAPLELAGDWTAVLRGFGLDPDVFEVASDTVRMSKWQTSKRLEGGDRDVVWLFSYRASFRRRTVPVLADSELEILRARVGKWKPVIRKQVLSDQIPCTMVLNFSDWQLGKGEGGGVEATVKRILSDFSAVVERVLELRKIGRNIEGIAFVNLGDSIEGCSDHYANQTFTVELNLRSQLLLATDLWCKGIITTVGLTQLFTAIAVPCNHGELSRRGSKNITDDADSVSGFLADIAQRILADNPNCAHIKWVTPDDQMTMTATLSGVRCAFTHGHKAQGKIEQWLRGQTLRLLHEEGVAPVLWFSGHFHHFLATDWGAFTHFQAPSNDGGSLWFLNQTGLWSQPGTLTVLVGKHSPNNWSDLAIL